MPTIFSHIAVPIAATLALGTSRVPPSMLLAGMLASIAPDFDGITRQFGTHLHGMWDHRGYTHTLGFALLMGLVGLGLAKHWKVSRLAGFAWMALCCFSHPLLDMLTSGGSGIAALWPLSGQRFFSPWRPIKVSPIVASQFFSQRGWQVVSNELLTIWLPLMALGLSCFALRHIRKSP
ncbi:MAG: metal-dependent hydrolase [Acidovorax sp.]|jgi:inner membrane protein|nr:metal-dependent hydrolase [Acidovorax sp.]